MSPSKPPTFHWYPQPTTVGVSTSQKFQFDFNLFNKLPIPGVDMSYEPGSAEGKQRCDVMEKYGFTVWSGFFDFSGPAYSTSNVDNQKFQIKMGQEGFLFHQLQVVESVWPEGKTAISDGRVVHLGLEQPDGTAFVRFVLDKLAVPDDVVRLSAHWKVEYEASNMGAMYLESDVLAPPPFFSYQYSLTGVTVSTTEMWPGRFTWPDQFFVRE